MGAEFIGRNITVRFSSGAVVEIFRAWVSLAEADPPTEDTQIILDYLRAELESFCTDGFILDENICEPEFALSTVPRLRYMAQLVERFAFELAYNKPGLAQLDVSWDKDLRLAWLGRMLDIYQIISDALPPNVPSFPAIELKLDEQDQRKVELDRLTRRKVFLEHHRNQDWKLQLNITEQIIGVLDGMPLQAGWEDRLREEQFDRIELLEKLGRQKEAAKAAHKLANLQTDQEMRQLLEEYATSLENASG